MEYFALLCKLAILTVAWAAAFAAYKFLTKKEVKSGKATKL